MSHVFLSQHVGAILSCLCFAEFCGVKWRHGLSHTTHAALSSLTNDWPHQLIAAECRQCTKSTHNVGLPLWLQQGLDIANRKRGERKRNRPTLALEITLEQRETPRHAIPSSSSWLSQQCSNLKVDYSAIWKQFTLPQRGKKEKRHCTVRRYVWSNGAVQQHARSEVGNLHVRTCPSNGLKMAAERRCCLNCVLFLTIGIRSSPTFLHFFNQLGGLYPKHTAEWQCVRFTLVTCGNYGVGMAEHGDGQTSGQNSVPVAPLSDEERERAGLAQSAFEAGSYDKCLEHLFRLQNLRPKDHKVQHNIAVAQYYRSQLTGTDDFVKALTVLKSQVFDLYSWISGTLSWMETLLMVVDTLVNFSCPKVWSELSTMERMLHVLRWSCPPINDSS